MVVVGDLGGQAFKWPWEKSPEQIQAEATVTPAVGAVIKGRLLPLAAGAIGGTLLGSLLAGKQQQQLDQTQEQDITQAAAPQTTGDMITKTYAPQHTYTSTYSPVKSTTTTTTKQETTLSSIIHQTGGILYHIQAPQLTSMPEITSTPISTTDIESALSTAISPLQKQIQDLAATQQAGQSAEQLQTTDNTMLYLLLAGAALLFFWRKKK